MYGESSSKKYSVETRCGVPISDIYGSDSGRGYAKFIENTLPAPGPSFVAAARPRDVLKKLQL